MLYPMTTPQERISAALRLTGRTHQDIAEHLGLQRVGVTQRMNGWTLWSLADAIQVAHLLDVPLDTLVKEGEDLPVGYVPAEVTA